MVLAGKDAGLLGYCDSPHITRKLWLLGNGGLYVFWIQMNLDLRFDVMRLGMALIKLVVL